MTSDLHDTPLPATRLAACLEAMHGAADAARAATLGRFRGTSAALAIEDKAASDLFDPVTAADREAEALIRAHLAREHPDIAFVGEESVSGELPRFSGAGASGRPTWVVDPIDGTRAFITGMPLWGTLIALHDGRDVALGLLDQPVLGERYVGGPDGAVLHAGGVSRRLSSRGGRALAEASLCCTTPDMFAAGEERAAFERVAAEARLARYGGDCYAYAQLAAGHVDVVVESDLRPWDVQALIPIVVAAGGVISDWSGGSAVDGGRVVAAGSAALHAEVLGRLAGRVIDRGI